MVLQNMNAAATLEGKTILVSGAASGMGAACAELARASGARILAVDRDEAGLAELAARIDVDYMPCDLADLDQLPRAVARCVDALDGLDGLVNAAGIFKTRELLEITPDDFDQVFAINVRALFFLQQAAARHMAARGRGSIVNFASTAARVPRPLSAHYAASKAAVVSITRSAAAALGGHGVRVNAVAPGVIETPMIDFVRRERARLLRTTPEAIDESLRAPNPMGRLGTANEVAEVVVFLLADSSSYVNGESIGVTGGTDFD
jgi:NAD(P)-dependent dehydrogenase (short-subunit alcohol dehydrogenase family)